MVSPSWVASRSLGSGCRVEWGVGGMQGGVRSWCGSFSQITDMFKENCNQPCFMAFIWWLINQKSERYISYLNLDPITITTDWSKLCKNSFENAQIAYAELPLMHQDVFNEGFHLGNFNLSGITMHPVATALNIMHLDTLTS